MKIHGLCILKDEGDIVETSLVRALDWCDHIYVFDNGSTDGTWEKVQALAKAHPGIVAFKQDAVPFRDALRADIFNAFRHNASEGDWWCRFDSDEIYIDNPRIFLSKIPARYGAVSSASFNYYFTEKDAAAWEADPADFERQTIEDRLRYYLAHWGEPRFFRHDPSMEWNNDGQGFPDKLFRTPFYPTRIWLKHYQYRSPGQIERRLKARWASVQRGTFAHESVGNWAGAIERSRTSKTSFGESHPKFMTTDWRDRVVPSSALHFDALDNRYVFDEALLPPIGLQLTASYAMRMMTPKFVRRLAKRVVDRSSGVETAATT